MAFIYETPNFVVESMESPHVSRQDGGHIRIRTKDLTVLDRTKLSAKPAIELMRLTMIVGQAMESAMNKQGIPVVKINYQDMGNWAYKTGKLPYLHIHIYGRAKNATKQPFPESVNLPDRSSGFYEGFEPLTNDDIRAIQEEIAAVVKDNKYDEAEWGLA